VAGHMVILLDIDLLIGKDFSAAVADDATRAA